MNCAPAVAGDKEKRVWNLETHCLLSKRIEEWINEMKAAIATGAKGGFILPYNNSSRTEESHCHLWKKKTVYPNPNSYLPKPPRLLLVCATANGTNTSTNELGLGGGGGAKGSGTTARGRRLLKIREEKRKREHDRLHNYPAWAKVLEDACKDDAELRAVLGDSVGNPELMRKRVEERVRKKGRDFSKSKTGSVLAFKVTFRDFNPLDSYIWFEFYGSPSDRDVELFGSVIQSWYVMGRLGAFNSTNLQLANFSMEYDPLYDVDKGFKVMPSSFHDISDVEFQDNWGRVWVDLGTADYFAVDVLLNCLTVLSSEYLGIQQIVFGGHRIGDWEEGMTNTEDGYKYFKI